MVIVLVGASGTGKDSVAKELMDKHGYRNIVSYTTREAREGEIDGIDYHFVSQEVFNSMNNSHEFIETDKYSGNRFYGSKSADYKTDEKLIKILTPNGVKQLIKNGMGDKIFIVYLYSPLATKCKRYINRENETFNIDKLIELTRRSIADAEMFRGFEDEADLVIENGEDSEIEDIVNLIINNVVN